MKTKEHFLTYGWIYLIIVICAIIIFVVVDDGVDSQKVRDEFCIKNGFNKSTDQQSNYYWLYADTKIECDNKEIFTVSLDKKCSELDKWGKCKKYSEYYLT